MNRLVETIADTIADDLAYEDGDASLTEDVIRERLAEALGTYRGSRMMEAYDRLVSEWRDLAGLR